MVEHSWLLVFSYNLSENLCSSNTMFPWEQDYHSYFISLFVKVVKCMIVTFFKFFIHLNIPLLVLIITNSNGFGKSLNPKWQIHMTGRRRARL